MEDCYTSSRGHTRTLGNFVKAVYFALAKTYGYLSPELWTPTLFQVGFAAGVVRLTTFHVVSCLGFVSGCVRVRTQALERTVSCGFGGTLVVFFVKRSNAWEKRQACFFCCACNRPFKVLWLLFCLHLLACKRLVRLVFFFSHAQAP